MQRPNQELLKLNIFSQLISPVSYLRKILYIIYQMLYITYLILYNIHCINKCIYRYFRILCFLGSSIHSLNFLIQEKQTFYSIHIHLFYTYNTVQNTVNDVQFTVLVSVLFVKISLLFTTLAFVFLSSCFFQFSKHRVMEIMVFCSQPKMLITTFNPELEENTPYDVYCQSIC